MIELSVGGSPTKLLEALEKLGVSPGSELRSPGGPGGLPDEDLVKAFEEALNAPLSQETAGEGGAPHMEQALTLNTEPSEPAPIEAPESLVTDQASGQEVRGTLAPERPGPAERLPDETFFQTKPSESGHGVTSVQDESGIPERIQSQASVEAPESTAEGRPLSETEPGEMFKDRLREVGELLERVTSGQASSTELFRLQYMVSMLQVQASSGSQVTQQVEQGFQSLLKQQG